MLRNPCLVLRHRDGHCASGKIAHRIALRRPVVCFSARYNDLATADESRESYSSIAANKELTRAATVEELVYTYEANEPEIAVVGTATTWVRLARLYNPARNDAASKALARRILGRTLRYIPEMGVRHLSNVMWAVGKIKLKLEDEAIGHHLAAELEARIRELIDKKSVADPLHVGQLWLGLAATDYKWAEDFLLELLDCTLTAAAGPEWTLRDLSFAVTNFYILVRCKPRIHENQFTRLQSLIDDAVATEEDDDELIGSAPSFAEAAVKLGLRLAPATLTKLHDTALLMPPFRLKEMGRGTCASMLFRFTRLGLQPTAAEVDTWAELLLQDLGGRWSDDELVWTAAALAACPSFDPPQELKRRVRDTLATRGDRLIHFKRSLLLDACKAWGIPLPAIPPAPPSAFGGPPRGAVLGKRK